MPTTIATDMKSITYFVGGTGEEQSDYTIKYANASPVDYTYYYYGSSNVRAGSALVNDAMKISQTQSDSTAPTTAGTATAKTKSITYYAGSVGEENRNGAWSMRS